jgi:hypothetical protein
MSHLYHRFYVLNITQDPRDMLGVEVRSKAGVLSKAFSGQTALIKTKAALAG